MRAFYRPDGRVRIGLPEGGYTEERRTARPYNAFVVDRVEFEELAEQIREGDSVREELKRSLDAALSQIERLSDDRDHWQQEAENQQKETELWKSLAQRQDNTAPIRLKLQAAERERDELKRLHATAMGDAFYWRNAWEEDRGPELDELKATVVRQANEITRLTGESE
ncbi:hypothetical protein AQJ23_44860 [Streptomyces antibioticus]|nr:hypothetical protein [Streptomyces antibioticus]KUN16528.1 hypothetical protein AQJ23_44860 [Streptomyces antibioticus]